MRLSVGRNAACPECGCNYSQLASERTIKKHHTADPAAGHAGRERFELESWQNLICSACGKRFETLAGPPRELTRTEWERVGEIERPAPIVIARVRCTRCTCDECPVTKTAEPKNGERFITRYHKCRQCGYTFSTLAPFAGVQKAEIGGQRSEVGDQPIGPEPPAAAAEKSPVRTKK